MTDARDHPRKGQNPSPQPPPRGGEGEQNLSCSPSPPRGGGWGEGSGRVALGAGEKAGLRYRLGLPPRAAGGPGATLGRRAGSSLEFRDYREYQPGDDLRHVDWNAYARSDQLTLKLFREEVTPHLDLVLDGSRSMALEASAKEAAALGLAAFFASAAAGSGHTHAAWLLGDRLSPVVNGTRAPSSWDGMSFVHG